MNSIAFAPSFGSTRSAEAVNRRRYRPSGWEEPEENVKFLFPLSGANSILDADGVSISIWVTAVRSSRVTSLTVTRKSPSEGAFRSEEHTSELQSLRHLVCRLLLEKKNKTKN